MEREDYKLGHLALYAKGHYTMYNSLDGTSKNSSIWDDLRVILTLDDYSAEFFSKKDIVTCILYHTDTIKTRAFKQTITFIEGISKEECWKYGYYTTDHEWVKNTPKLNLGEYDMYEAVIHYILSNLRLTPISDLGLDNLPYPIYGEEGLPRPLHLTDEELEKYKFFKQK